MLIFDEYGLLTPAEGILATADTLYDTFVQPFTASETRERLFHEWTKYNRMLRHDLGEGFTQWVDGSFVTQKVNPKDIDVVSFIPSYLFRKFEKRLDYYWTDNWEREGIDAYLVQEYPATWPEFESTLSLRRDWLDRYTKVKGNNLSKGFLIIAVV